MADIVTLEEIDFSKFVQQGDLVSWGQGPAEPVTLTNRLLEQRHSIGPFRCFTGFGWANSADPVYTDLVQFSSYCGAGTNRKLAKAGKLTILPVHYSVMAKQLPKQVDVLLIQLAPTADKGILSFGLACEYLLPLIHNARLVIAEINSCVPATMAEHTLFADDIDIAVHTSRELPQPGGAKLGAIENKIAAHIAGLIEDGATLQMGLGSIPGAVLSALSAHNNLGVHSGMVSDSVVDLIKCGALTNAQKPSNAQHVAAGLLAGGDDLNNFVKENPDLIRLHATSYTHDGQVLAGLNRFTAINSAIEVDLCGQVNSELAGGVYVGAVGGLVDFIRGAHQSYGGLPIIALPSLAQSKHGPVSRIVANLSGPATLAHGDAPIIVTEYGVADLRGVSFAERKKRLIDIAHPDFREALSNANSLIQPAVSNDSACKVGQ